MQEVKKLGKGLYSYKGAIIRKRSGMDMRRRTVSGYSLRFADESTQAFSKLADALAWVDQKVGA